MPKINTRNTTTPTNYSTGSKITNRYARLTRSQITAPLTPAARSVLQAICYYLKPEQNLPISLDQLARWSQVSKSTVSAALIELAAEPGAHNTIPFIRRTWHNQERRYYICRLPAPEERGWFYAPPAPPEPEPTSAQEPALNLSQSILFLMSLMNAVQPIAMPQNGSEPGSIIEPPQSNAVQPIAMPQNGSEPGSIIEPPSLYHDNHNNKLASEPVFSSFPEEETTETGVTMERETVSNQLAAGKSKNIPPAPSSGSATPPAPVQPVQLYDLTSQGVYTGLARKVLAAQPGLTRESWQASVQLLDRRGRYNRPAVVAATILARGEQVVYDAPPEPGPEPEQVQAGQTGLSPYFQIAYADLPMTVRSFWLKKLENAPPGHQYDVLRQFYTETGGGQQ